MKDRFPLKILEQDNQFKATTSISQLQDKSRNIRQDLSYVELDYATLIKSLRDIFHSKKSKKTDPRLYWLIGDYIFTFLRRIDQLGYYLVRHNQTLAKSMGISESSVKKILSFRRRCLNISLIDPAIPWAKYRDNKVPIQQD